MHHAASVDSVQTLSEGRFVSVGRSCHTGSTRTVRRNVESIYVEQTCIEHAAGIATDNFVIMSSANTVSFVRCMSTVTQGFRAPSLNISVLCLFIMRQEGNGHGYGCGAG